MVKGTEYSTVEVDSSVPLTHHDPKNPELICLVKKRKIELLQNALPLELISA